MKQIIRLQFLILLFVGCTGKKNKFTVQSASQDSVELHLSKAENNLLSLAEQEREYLAAYASLKNLKNSKYKREALLKLLNALQDLKKFNDLYQPNKDLLTCGIDSKDTLSIAYSYYFSGNRNLSLNVQDSAYYYFSKAKKLFLKRGNDKMLSALYLKISSIQLSYVDFLGAEHSASQALKYSKTVDDKLGQYDALTNLGIASHSSENYGKAVEYYTMALDLAKTSNLNPEYFLQEISLNNIGNCYIFAKKYRQAIVQFEKALQNEKISSQKPGLYATLLDNVSYSKFKLTNDRTVLKYFLKSLSIRESLKLDSKVVYSKIHLSEYYSNKDTIIAQRYANEALALAKRNGFSADVLGALKQITNVEHKNVFKYSKEYIKINDSIQLEERKSKDKFARIAFETDEILSEKDKLAEQNRSLLYFFIGTLFLGVLLFVIRTQRAKNRELLLKQQQQEANEEIYNLMISQQATIEENRVKEKKRIAQELHDGVLGRLFGARLNLDSLNKFTDEESINNRFNYLSELKNIEQDIREISHDLNREKYVLINNFVAIVTNLLEEQRNSFDPDIQYFIDEKIKWDLVSNAVKINLFRILQESLQNINKYAEAKRITVDLKRENNSIILSITDDGKGFEVSAKRKGIGLQNMLSRANECGGVFDIKSKKGKGTSITISIPVEIHSLNTLA